MYKKSIDLNRLSLKAIHRGHWCSYIDLRNVDFPSSKPRTDIRVACILGDKLFRCLSYEFEILLLQEDNWKPILSFGKPDFVLIESCFESCTGQWKEGLIVPNDAHRHILELLELSHSLGIPTVFWQTLDTYYDNLFSSISQFFDIDCYSDPRSIETYKAKRRDPVFIAPCIQPVLHNPFRSYTQNKLNIIPIIYDGWGDLHRLGEQTPSILGELKKLGLYIIDSNYYLWKSKLKDAFEFAPKIFGCLNQKSLWQVLRYGKIGVTFEPTTLSRTTQQWWTFEAIGCGVEVMHFGHFLYDDIRKSIVAERKSNEEYIRLVQASLDDEYHRCLKVRESRRQLGLEHTYAKRMEKICMTLGLSKKFSSPVKKVTCLTVIRSQHELVEVIDNFNQQTYQNRELIAVGVGCNRVTIPEDMDAQHITLLKLPNSDFTQAYSTAAQYSKGDFCIQFGPECKDGFYLLDMVLDAEASRADVFGMPSPVYFTEPEENRTFNGVNYCLNYDDLKQKADFDSILFCSGTTDQIKLLPKRCCVFMPKNLHLMNRHKEFIRLKTNSIINGRPPVVEKIVAAMATIPHRIKILPKVLDRLLPQFDQIYVYLNGHAEIPDCVRQDKINYAWSKDYGDLGASGKFFFLDEAKDAYYFTVDDDFYYPHDYSYKMITSLKKYSDKVAVCVHGSIFGSPLDWYFERTAVFSAQHSLDVDRFVTLPGTATLAFNTKYASLCFDDFFPKVMCDVQFSVKARSQGLPIVSIHRPKKWIVAELEDQTGTGYQDYWTMMLIDDMGRTEVAQSYDWSFFNYAPMVIHRMDELFPGISESELEANKFDTDFISAARSNRQPKLWDSENSTTYNIKKYQNLNKKLKVLSYMDEHGHEPNLQELFTKENILSTDTRVLLEIKERIRNTQEEIGKIQNRLKFRKRSPKGIF